ncbi:MAG TPA: hypothetical protein PLV85_13020 [Polyangiaceae bacterium]|nr:hypothetical protein [Polyangiaceae bacterium]
MGWIVGTEPRARRAPIDSIPGIFSYPYCMMAFRKPWHVVALAATVYFATSVTGCTQDGPVAQSESEAASPMRLPTSLPGWEPSSVLEVAPDGRAIIGKELAVPPRSTARQVYEAAFIDEKGNSIPIPIGSRIQDARFAFPPSSLVALLDDRDRLFVWNSKTGDVTPIDESVFPGFGFAHASESIIYAKGQTPELAAFRVDLPGGSPLQLTKGDTPVWGFAFSPDDKQVVFVDAPDGFPTLVVMDSQGGKSHRLTNRRIGPDDVRAGAELAPFPDGRRPPLWIGTTVFLENSAGVFAIDRFGSVRVRYDKGRDLHLDVSAMRALFRDGARVRQVLP